MEMRRVGNSGLLVSAIGLGGNTFGATIDGEDAVRTIQHAIDQGITFIDTADVYSMGCSEELVGQAIAGRRETVVVATKCGIPLDSGPHAGGLSRRWVTQAVEDSLRRLGTDYIDLFYAHRPDPSTPIEETLSAMDDLVRAGKVCYIGCSNFRAWEVAHSMGSSRLQRLEHWMAVQNRWNLLDGLDSPELEQAAETLGLGIIPYTPLASGLLTGKYHPGVEPPAGTRFGDLERIRERMTEDKLRRAERVKAWAEERGHTPAEAAIAWLLAHPVVPSVIAGARSPEQIDANIKAAAWTMTPEERDELRAVSAASD
ncbi:MAG TPA: aldo/keto reductase [Thermomicrobiales bacterium]|nr:aldo/keto reductase [Thermomicrobiales bacterium]